MFSTRLKWDLEPNPLARLAAEKRALGTRILDLTESNPTHAGIAYPPEITACFNDVRALRYDPSPRGLESARQAVAKYYADRGRKVSLDQILLTASTSEAYAYLFKLLCDPGDEILTPRPSYPLFEFLAGLESVVVRQYPLRYDGVWHIDFEELERMISPHTRAIVVVNPNNPTGSFVKVDEWDRLRTLAAKHDLSVLSDEVFLDYSFDSESQAEACATSDSYGTGFSLRTGKGSVFTMSGLSKIAGLPQMKLGWIVVNDDAAMERLELIADTYLSVSTPVQIALPKLLDLSKEMRARIRERTRSNLDLLKSTLAGTAVQALNVEGGWNAVLQVPRIRSEQEWALMLLGERDVLVQPGFFYDFESEAFLVVSLLTSPDVFAEGIGRII